MIRSLFVLIYAITPTSILGTLGLQNGDTLVRINGQDLTTPDQALAVSTKLRDAKRADVDLLRGVKPAHAHDQVISGSRSAVPPGGRGTHAS